MAAQIKHQNNVITNERGFERALSRKDIRNVARFSCLGIFANVCLNTFLGGHLFFLEFFFFLHRNHKIFRKSSI